jgi:sulfite reductase (NADPH) hemoprotein beta-component
VLVGGGMGRTPIIGTVVREFLPWQHLLSYLEACIRVYNQYGRRDNVWKARIKILVKAEGQRYIDKVEEEFRQIVEIDGAPHTITQAESTAWPRSSSRPDPRPQRDPPASPLHEIVRADAEPIRTTSAGCSATCRSTATPNCAPSRCRSSAWARRPATPTGRPARYRRPTWPSVFSPVKARVHARPEPAACPGCTEDDLPELWAAARKAGLASPTSAC